jgi:hypothetical protein
MESVILDARRQVRYKFNDSDFHLNRLSGRGVEKPACDHLSAEALAHRFRTHTI